MEYSEQDDDHEAQEDYHRERLEQQLIEIIRDEAIMSGFSLAIRRDLEDWEVTFTTPLTKKSETARGVGANFYEAWDAVARDRDSFKAWVAENILQKGPEAFARYARRAA